MSDFAELEVVFVECNTGRMDAGQAWKKLMRFAPENVALVDSDDPLLRRIYFLIPAYDSHPLAIPAGEFVPEGASKFPDDHKAMSFARNGK